MAVVVASFLSFGAYHADPNGHPNQWQWMIIATTIMTFSIFILFVLFFPDNPTNAYFLTKEEKIKVIRRVKENQNGIETKTWKMYQFFEAVKDVRTWLFFFYVGFGYVTIWTYENIRDLPSVVSEISLEALGSNIHFS